MKRIAVLVVAGLATAATAQSVSLDFDLDGVVGNNVVINSTSGSWTVYASFTGFPDPTAYFGGFAGDWIAAGDGNASNLVSLMAHNNTTPWANGASIMGLEIGNTSIFGTDDQDNPLAIFTFDTSGTNTSLTYVSAVGLAGVVESDIDFTFPTQFFDAQISVTSDTLIPAPGAFALLGLVGLVAVRRRR